MKMAVTSLYPLLHPFLDLVFVASFVNNGGKFRALVSGVRSMFAASVV